MPTYHGRPSRRRFIRGLGLASLGLLAGCAPTQSAAPVGPPLGSTAAPTAGARPQPAMDPPLSPPVTVRVGQVVATSEAGQFIALERCCFQEQGIEVEYTQFDAAGRMTPLLASGQLDVGTGAIGAGFFNALARGIPIKIVGPQARHDPGASAVYVMVRQDLVDRGLFQGY